MSPMNPDEAAALAATAAEYEAERQRRIDLRKAMESEMQLKRLSEALTANASFISRQAPVRAPRPRAPAGDPDAPRRQSSRKNGGDGERLLQLPDDYDDKLSIVPDLISGASQPVQRRRFGAWRFRRNRAVVELGLRLGCDHGEQLVGADLLADRNVDRLDGAGDLRLDRVLHLHGLDDE